MQAGLAAQETDVDRCNEHLSQAVGAVKKLMDGFLPPPQGLDSSGQQGEGAGSQQQQQQQQQQAAQQAYLYHTKALREGLKTLLQRRVEQEQAAAAGTLLRALAHAHLCECMHACMCMFVRVRVCLLVDVHDVHACVNRRRMCLHACASVYV